MFIFVYLTTIRLQFYSRFFITVLEFEDLYLENLPNIEMYEQSFMHRDVITHIVVTK